MVTILLGITNDCGVKTGHHMETVSELILTEIMMQIGADQAPVDKLARTHTEDQVYFQKMNRRHNGNIWHRIIITVR